MRHGPHQCYILELEILRIHTCTILGFEGLSFKTWGLEGLGFNAYKSLR
jgi:hypothetical protein